MAKGGYAPVNGFEPYYEVHDGEGADFLPEERPEEVTDGGSDLLGTRSRP